MYLIERLTMSSTVPSKTPEEKVDVPLRFGKSSYDRLLALQSKVEADSLGNVAKNSFRVYEALVDEAEAGATFFIKRKGDDSPVPYEVF